jgi:hypothetical protein
MTAKAFALQVRRSHNGEWFWKGYLTKKARDRETLAFLEAGYQVRTGPYFIPLESQEFTGSEAYMEDSSGHEVAVDMAPYMEALTKRDKGDKVASTH